MYYLIDKTSGRAIEEAQSKGVLRKLKKKNPDKYVISKKNPNDNRYGHRTGRFSAEELIAQQEEINRKREERGLKIIVPVPSAQAIMNRQSREIDPEKLMRELEELHMKIVKEGALLILPGVTIKKKRNRKRRKRKLKMLML